MNVELHCHSNHSKGQILYTEAIPSPKEIIREAKRKGLGAVALTDHRVNTGWREAKAEAKRQGMLFIPAMEFNTLSGHLIGLGLTDYIPSWLPIEETVEKIHQQGGLAVAVHPFDIKGDGTREDCLKADAVEVFNSLNLDRFSNGVIKRKLNGIQKSRVVGSDAHTLDQIGNAVNIIDADTLDEVLKKIKKGSVSHQTSYTPTLSIKRWTHLRLTGSYEDTISHINKNYPLLKRWISLRFLKKFVQHDDLVFDSLAHFAIFCSYGYGFAKMLKEL